MREFYGYGSSVPVWGDCRTIELLPKNCRDEDDELTRKGEWSCLGGSRDVEVESADSFCCFLCGDEYASGPCGKCHAARGCSIIQPRCFFYTSTSASTNLIFASAGLIFASAAPTAPPPPPRARPARARQASPSSPARRETNPAWTAAPGRQTPPSASPSPRKVHHPAPLYGSIYSFSMLSLGR